MNITGNKKIDPWIKLGLAAGGTYALVQVLKSVIESSGGATGQTNIIDVEGCSLSALRKSIIGSAMDKIYTSHAGANLWNYPEYVNVILKYNQCELEFANAYFLTTYGETLYFNINSQWDIDGDYTPALNKLQIAGLAN